MAGRRPADGRWRGGRPKSLSRADGAAVDLAFDPGELRGKGGKWIKSRPGGAAGLTKDLGALRERHPGVQMEVGKTGDKTARLSLIRTSEEARGGGHAQAAMHDLTALADHHAVTLHLSAEPLAGDRKTKKTRLTQWYGSHGFVANKGRNKDYAISDTMIRPPSA